MLEELAVTSQIRVRNPGNRMATTSGNRTAQRRWVTTAYASALSGALQS